MKLRNLIATFFLLLLATSLQSQAQTRDGKWVAFEASNWDKSNIDNAIYRNYALIVRLKNSSNDYDSELRVAFARYLHERVLSNQEKSSPFKEPFRSVATETTWNNLDNLIFNMSVLDFGDSYASMNLQQITDLYIQSKKERIGKAVLNYSDDGRPRHYSQIQIRTFKLREDGKSFEETSAERNHQRSLENVSSNSGSSQNRRQCEAELVSATLRGCKNQVCKEHEYTFRYNSGQQVTIKTSASIESTEFTEVGKGKYLLPCPPA